MLRIWPGRYELDERRKHPKCDCFDQDILNYFYAGVYQPLPVCYNTFVVMERLEKESVLRSAFYHYAGGEIDIMRQDVFMELYLFYFMKSPWFNAAVLQKIFRTMKAVSRATKGYDRGRVNALLRGKRVFWGDAIARDRLEEFFSLAPEDRCLEPARDAQGVYQGSFLLTDMQAQAGEGRIYVLLIKEKLYVQLRDWLQSYGFAEYQDFINGMDFLPKEDGGTMGLDGTRIFARL